MGHRRQSQRFALRLKPLGCLFVGSPAHEAVKLGAIVIYQADSAESEVIQTPARAASHHIGDDRNALWSSRQCQANRCTFARDRFGTVHHPLAHPVSEATRSPADTGNKRLGQEATHEPSGLIPLRGGASPSMRSKCSTSGIGKVEHVSDGRASVNGALFIGETGVLGDVKQFFDVRM